MPGRKRNAAASKKKKQTKEEESAPSAAVEQPLEQQQDGLAAAPIVQLPPSLPVIDSEDGDEEILWDSKLSSMWQVSPPAAPVQRLLLSSPAASPADADPQDEKSVVALAVPESMPLRKRMITSLHSFHDRLARLLDALMAVTQHTGDAQAAVHQCMSELLECDYVLQRQAKQLAERQAMYLRMKELEAQVHQSKEGFVSFAKELGGYERELYEFASEDASRALLSVRDITVLAERLGVMSHSPAQIQEKMAQGLSRPPGPQPGVRGGSVDMSRLHHSAAELAEIAESEQQSEMDYFLLTPMIEPLVVSTAHSVQAFHELQQEAEKETEHSVAQRRQAKATQLVAMSKEEEVLSALQLHRASSIEGLFEMPEGFDDSRLEDEDDDF